LQYVLLWDDGRIITFGVKCAQPKGHDVPQDDGNFVLWIDVQLMEGGAPEPARNVSLTGQELAKLRAERTTDG
jgi:hypothetical protein